MRTPIVLVTALLTVSLARPVQAVTIQEIIELSRAGLSAEVLVALVETSDTVFTLDAARILELKEAGVPERVIVALITKGRRNQDPTLPPPSAPASTAPAAPVVVVVQDEEPYPPPAPVVLMVPVPFPVVVSGVGRTSGFVSRPHVPVDARMVQPFPHGIRRPGRFINDGFGVTTMPTPVGEPVYWGWGGKLRPDAWGQPRRPPQTTSR